MGSQQSTEEVVVAQSGGQVEVQLSQQYLMMLIIIVLMAMALAFLLWRHCKGRLRNWMRKQAHPHAAACPAAVAAGIACSSTSLNHI